MIKRIFALLLVVAIYIVALAGCTNDVKNTKNAVENTGSEIVKYPLTVKDSFDREVTIDKEPERIVSLGPNITETIFSLGNGKKLIGRTEYCDYPNDVKKIDSVGTLAEPSIEKIASLKPDIVIASTHFNKELIKKFESLNIKIVVLYGSENFDGVYDTIQKTGTILNSKKSANDLVAGMKTKVTEIQKKIANKEKTLVYYVVFYGKGGEFTAGGDTFIGQMIEMVGGKNSAGDIKGWKYSIEKLVEKNPDILICSKHNNSKAGIIATNGYKDLKAVKEGKIYEIDNNLLDRQGPRLADGLEELAKIIHPEAFK